MSFSAGKSFQFFTSVTFYYISIQSCPLTDFFTFFFPFLNQISSLFITTFHCHFFFPFSQLFLDNYWFILEFIKPFYSLIFFTIFLGQVLESVNFGAYSGNSKPTDDEATTVEGVVTSPPPSHSQPSSVSSSNGMENVCGGRSLGHWPLASHRPFLQLVLMCLDGQDDQLSELLESLRTQLTQSLFYPKEVCCTKHCTPFLILVFNFILSNFGYSSEIKKYLIHFDRYEIRAKEVEDMLTLSYK